MDFQKTEKFFTKIWFLWEACVILDIITFLFIYYKIRPGGRTLALHYNVLLGVQWYGAGRNLYFIPGVGAAILAVNFILYRALRNNENFLAELAPLVSLFVELILLAAALFLAKVN